MITAFGDDDDDRPWGVVGHCWCMYNVAVVVVVVVEEVVVVVVLLLN